MTAHRVLVVRPWNVSDAGSSGCCGGSAAAVCDDVVGDSRGTVHRGDSRETAEGETLARIYRALRESLPDDVGVEIVDPRNHMYLVPTIVRDARRRGLPLSTALRVAVRGPAHASILVDGDVVCSGGLPEPDAAVALVRQALTEPAVR